MNGNSARARRHSYQRSTGLFREDQPALFSFPPLYAIRVVGTIDRDGKQLTVARSLMDGEQWETIAV